MRDYSRLFIDGAWRVPSGQGRAEVADPATEQVVGAVPLGDERDVDNAVAAARRAFGPWSRTPSAVRAGYIRALAGQLRQRADEMAALITAELGMPVQWCRAVQVDGPIVGLEQYVELAGAMDEVREVGNSLVVREPVGVCAFINPWNYPLHQLIGKLAPALAAGCTVVLKPSQETPLHAFLLAEMIEVIGLPAGVFNLVSGPGSKVGEALARHPDVDMLSFTGSTGAGVRVAQAAAPSVKRVCLELGGKSPLLIGEDADLAAAVCYGVQDVMINSGQTCTALTRMLLPARRYAEALELAVEEVRSLRMGDPLDSQSFLGPMCSASQRRTVEAYIQLGQQEGARLLVGGAAQYERGHYVAPTLFADVDNRMRIAQEEIFGPVLCLIPYADEAQAVALANDSPFGLSSGVWAASPERALGLARQLRAGQCFINGAAFNYQAPFGGYKQSGNGREWGEEGLAEFVEIKAIQR
ncbi:aldehyde dehydrogenase family protein [Pseudomonas chlororaphis]|uniref:aldehyde dehydrogenase family protein n=1 Tax=Pseudomonas chlororaphis TaxID=587753 RepID=UPI000F58C88E|nr:aldehyde dehydrogenase family protein [Pseudomonas chlororaphis]AZC50336.1 Aldehyde dehydrogenase [Pseudomonas chlororaphis subsp. piscium]AZC56912.1 Aldehyde dehydrogenase [Pseudomonas chlororaphis subsp. piscium]AZC75546.1 Aldehyde dehydrogenase [Pseudomonas chlororaphis subsp. piscium]AZC81828.1 Aldehyde dehydrogenase [Pseudomonas chlororaphis subsp. piscium]MBP5054934.1 aldehyde dehydrogenase family protein [Pseudomonas chlororaphis]